MKKGKKQKKKNIHELLELGFFYSGIYYGLKVIS